VPQLKLETKIILPISLEYKLKNTKKRKGMKKNEYPRFLTRVAGIGVSDWQNWLRERKSGNRKALRE
jgi:hypothetical protein